MAVKKMKCPEKPGKKPSVVNNRFRGPVSDLERHLPSEWWRNLFNSLYLKTDGDVVENQENTRQDIDWVLKILPIKPDDRVFDLCCGQGRHSLEMARRGFNNVTGMDRSRYLIRQARQRALSENLHVAFCEGDARKFRRPKETYDYVLVLGNSFGYFEEAADDSEVLKCVLRSLKPGGTVLMDVVDGEWMRKEYEPRSWEWIDGNHFVCRERSLSHDHTRLISREVITHAEKGVIADQFYAERLYARQELMNLLRSVGFQNVACHEPPSTISDRGQDLGMLSRRLIITGQSPTAPLALKPKFRDIVVLLGDPRLADKVKKNGHFNQADIDTVNKMKEALSELKKYRFTYVDDHAEMLSLLTKKPPEFIFNLCDEGYRNDPLKELHVPAFLEMLGIPYTGAGPSCLGLCYNKSLVRAIAQMLEIPVPAESYFGPDDSLATLPSTFPVLVKPNCGDSSMGITKNAVISSSENLMSYIHWIHETYGRVGILIQEFLSGTEYSIGIIGNPGLSYKILAPLEVDYSGLESDLPQILGYESKWDPDSPYWTQIQYRPAKLSVESQRQLYDYSNLLFERLECRDYARFDYRRDRDGRIKLLEVNPNPGWCWDGKFNMMANLEGIDYPGMLKMIVSAAQERIIV